MYRFHNKTSMRCSFYSSTCNTTMETFNFSYDLCNITKCERHSENSRCKGKGTHFERVRVNKKLLWNRQFIFFNWDSAGKQGFFLLRRAVSTVTSFYMHYFFDLFILISEPNVYCLLLQSLSTSLARAMCRMQRLHFW